MGTPDVDRTVVRLPDPAIDFVLSGDAAVYDVIRAEAAAMDAEDYDAVAEAHHRLDELNGYDASARAGRLLHGLGFPPDTHSRPVSSFSGGWRVRLNLARALMMPSDLLLRRPERPLNRPMLQTTIPPIRHRPCGFERRRQTEQQAGRDGEQPAAELVGDGRVDRRACRRRVPAPAAPFPPASVPRRTSCRRRC